MLCEIQRELNEFVIFVEKCFGESLKSIIVYGSYARKEIEKYNISYVFGDRKLLQKT